MTQLQIPFLAPDDVATIDAARVAIDRAQTKAWMARRTAEADELGRLGEQLVDILERNATAVRAARPIHHPARSPLTDQGGAMDQVHSTSTEHLERMT